MDLFSTARAWFEGTIQSSDTCPARDDRSASAGDSSQKLAEKDDLAIIAGQREAVVDQTRSFWRVPGRSASSTGELGQAASKALLSADQDDVELDRFLGLRFRGCHRHLGLDRVRIDDGEARTQDRFGQRLPSFITGVVIAEHKQAIIL